MLGVCGCMRDWKRIGVGSPGYPLIGLSGRGLPVLLDYVPRDVLTATTCVVGVSG